MLLPASISLIVINNDISVNYFYLALLVTLILFVIDVISSKISGNSEIELSRLLDNKLLFYISLLFLFVSLILNIYIHDGIPILDFIENKDYANTRAFHAKSSNLFIYASYAINYCDYLFIPYVLYYALNNKRYALLVILSPVFLLSYIFFLSKLPITFCLFVVMGVYFSCKYKFSLYKYILVVMLVMSAISLVNVLSVSGSGADKSNNYAVAGVYRSVDQDGLYGFLNNKIYRVFWVPSEVSALWLDYNKSNGEEVGAGFTVNYPNIIGKKYYVSRYPDKYTNDLSAYASFEVDALVRYGYVGMFLSFAVWGSARFIMAYWVKQYGNNLINSYFLVGSAMMLPQASIQALMLSNGFIFIILAPYLISLLNKNLGKRYLPFSKSL